MSSECYCESYYRYTCPNCRDVASGKATRPMMHDTRRAVFIDSNPENNQLPVTDGVWEGEDDN